MEATRNLLAPNIPPKFLKNMETNLAPTKKFIFFKINLKYYKIILRKLAIVKYLKQ